MFDSTSVDLVRTRTADGILLHGAMTGVGGRHGLLAAHGAWGNFYATPVFDLLQAAPERSLAALCMNNRGHDLGSLGDGEPCIGLARERFEDAPLDFDAAADVLAEIGVQDVVVVAHSFGAHKAAYWIAERRPPQVKGLVLLSPGPHLTTTERWFVEGTVADHVATAEAAIAAGRPNQLIVLSSSAPIPMVAEAATVMSIWGPDTLADASLHLPEVDVPVLVTIGDREPAPYRAQAEAAAASSSGAELLVLPDDHYYAKDRKGLLEAIFDWMGRHQLLDLT